MSWKAVKTTYSSKTGEKYYIKQDTATKNYSCTCKSWVFSNESPKICKHIAAVLIAKQKPATLINGQKPKIVETYWIVRNAYGKLYSDRLHFTEYSAKTYLKAYNSYCFPLNGKIQKVRLVGVK